MENAVQLAWGIETETGVIWSETFPTRRAAIVFAERLSEELWVSLKKDWGLKAVRVVIQKFNGRKG